MKITEIFYFVDEFCKEFMPFWKKKLIDNGFKKRNRECTLSASEIMTILILFHTSKYRDFKAFYNFEVLGNLKYYFPNTLSYNRFIELKKSVLAPMLVLLCSMKSEKTGIYFIDSTPLKVCHIKREKQNKVFKGIAKKSKSTMGWFFGFKLHLVINNLGEIVSFQITESTCDDRSVVQTLAKNLLGKLIGDKGYIKSELFQELFERGLELITKIKKNMKNCLVNMKNKMLLKKRAIVESVIGQLKNICHIEHTRHRSFVNFIINIFGGLIAYGFKDTKPSVNCDDFR